MFLECFNCGGTGMVCEFCSGDGNMYESSEYPDDLYRLEEIFPMQGREVVCPVCGGSGEVFVGGEEDDLEL